MARTERELGRRKNEKKWQTCWCYWDQQKAYRMVQASAEKLEHTGPAEKVASVPHRESSWQVRQSRLFKKEKEQSRLSRAPDREGRESQGKQEPYLDERGGSEREHGEETPLQGGLHSEGRQIPRRRGRASNKSLPSRRRRKHERVSGRKSSPERSAKSWSHSMFGQT